MFTWAENALGPRGEVACSSGQGMAAQFSREHLSFLVQRVIKYS